MFLRNHNLGGQRYSYIVDLPGYGYAKTSKDKRSDWQTLIKSYIAERRSLKRVFTLVDARHGLKDNDREFFSFLDTYAVNYQIILTKIDKVKKTELPELLDEINSKIEEHPACNPEFLMTSAIKKSGISEIRDVMFSILGLNQNNWQISIIIALDFAMNGKIENNFKQTAATLAEALPYIQRYEGSTIVIKLGGPQA